MCSLWECLRRRDAPKVEIWVYILRFGAPFVGYISPYITIIPLLFKAMEQRRAPPSEVWELQ